MQRTLKRSRIVQVCQLSGNGYRGDSAKLLHPARKLWDSQDKNELARLIELYPRLAKASTEGKVTYGPQSGRPKNEVKNATDAHEAYEILVAVFSSAEGEVEMNLEQLKTVRDWKMVRNRVRQNWLLVDQNEDNNVKKVTASAFKLADEGDWHSAMMEIDKGLRGVGPATASMILSLRYPKIAPYGEEAFRVAGISSSKYTLSEYEIFFNLMNGKADEMGCTARDLERAIYAAVYEGRNFETGDNDPDDNNNKKKRRISEI